MHRRSVPLAALLVDVILAAATGCSPVIRLGDIEPPEGRRTLVDLELHPERQQEPSPDHLAAAVGDAGVATMATTPLPAVPADDALHEMTTNVQGLSVSAKEAVVDEAEIATDARRLEFIYMARGYFRAKNLGYDIDVRGEDRAAVSFTVLEHQETVVTEIRFLGACEQTPDHDADDDNATVEDDDPERPRRLREVCGDLAELIPMRVGDIWTEESYANGLDVVSRAFRAEGFIHARVIGDNWVSRDRNEAAVWYQIDSGPLVRVLGEVIIEGNVNVDTERIRQRIDIREGDVIDDESLRETEHNIQDLGPFFSVQAAPVYPGTGERFQPPTPGVPAQPEGAEEPPQESKAEPPEGEGDKRGDDESEDADEDESDDEADEEPEEEEERGPERPSRMPLKVALAEAALWELTIGPSVATDFIRLDLALPVAFTHRSLFGEVVALQASARPALVLPDCFTGEACFDRPEFGLESKLGIGVPSFFEEYLRLSLDASYERDPSQDTKIEKIGGSIGLSRSIVRGLTARVGYNLAFFNYFGGSALFEPAAAAEAVELADLRFQRKDLIAYWDASLVLDLRDSPLDSRNGGYATLSVNFAGPYSGSEATYIRLRSDVRGYWTPRFYKALTLAARVSVGWIFFDHSVGTPLSARFKSGGATSMRGFATDRLGDYICSGEYGNLHGLVGFGDRRGTYGRYVSNPHCSQDSSARTYIGGNYLFESNFEVRYRTRSGLGLVAFIDIGRVWSLEQEVDLGKLYVAIGPGLRYETPVGPIRLDVGFLLGRLRDERFHVSLGQAF